MFHIKNSTTLKNQDFINYLEKIVELSIEIGSVLTSESCEVTLWVYNCSLLEFTYRRLTEKLTPVIKSLNSDSTQPILAEWRNFKGDPLCPGEFFFRRVIKQVNF